MEKITDVEIYCELDYNSSGSFKEYYPAAEVDAAFQAVRELVGVSKELRECLNSWHINNGVPETTKRTRLMERSRDAIAAVEALEVKD